MADGGESGGRAREVGGETGVTTVVVVVEVEVVGALE